ncbi:MAG TPA: hypothetical protein VMB80_08700 [Candidatus Acidoferrum sp.]|nr:hypothetical protein [Candidatus Acidoferrum sp.]
MPKQIPATSAGWTAWANALEEKSPARFRAFILAVAVVLMVAHYTIDEIAYHPETSLWQAWTFWSGAWIYAAWPFVNWLAWRLVSAGRLKTAKPILIMTAVLSAGSILALCLPNILGSIEIMHLHRFDPPIEKWHWFAFRFYWRFWTAVVLVIGNLVLLWRWRRAAAESTELRAEARVVPDREGAIGSTRGACAPRASVSRSSMILKILAVTSATVACGVTALHLFLPRVPANEDVVDIARNYLIEARLRNDFDYLIQHSFSPGRPLAPWLMHLELADLQRHQFYPNLDDATFREYVLSPETAVLPLPEVNWRRTLWENFCPRIRHETDPIEAAQIVVRFLRERVGIDPSYDYRVGVETIWTEQMTDDAGFERIYVATLRSVGIAARLNDAGQAELLEGNQWQVAPRVLVSSLEDKKFPGPKHGLVNFRNWAGDDWPQ